LVLLDTHIWLWWLLGEPNLSKDEHAKLDKIAKKGGIFISWVTLWEVEMLERKNRIQLLPDLKTWFVSATDSKICTVLPVDQELIVAQRELPEDFHLDPADRLIAATAFLADMPLVTNDQKIRSSGACRIWHLK